MRESSTSGDTTACAPDPETPEELEERARARLAPATFDYIAGGAGDEWTLRRNRTAWRALTLRPQILPGAVDASLERIVMGVSVQMPILVAPMAFHGLCDDAAEAATARAADALGSILVASTLSTLRIESITAGMSDRRRCWFQLYIHRDRGLTRTLVQRAEAAGCGALCLTVDTPLAGGRERDRRNHFRLPDHLTLGNFSAEHSELHRMAGDGSSVTAYVGQQLDPALTWSDVEWLRSITQLPVLVKGVLHPDDARLAVDHGATGVIVSNHGGRQLDGTPSSIERLPAIVEAVAPETEVLLDGGVRTGSDVLKAIALGARAVLVGRPILWGLAVAGQDGVARVLAQLRDELADAMRVTGCALLDDIGPHVLRPAVDGNSRIHP